LGPQEKFLEIKLLRRGQVLTSTISLRAIVSARSSTVIPRITHTAHNALATNHAGVAHSPLLTIDCLNSKNANNFFSKVSNKI
jgi:hypothetical protein